MTATPKLTDARRRGLAVLVDHDRARISNITDRDAGYVYWQTADWLLSVGYARTTSATSIGLTDAGTERAKTESLEAFVADAQTERPPT